MRIAVLIGVIACGPGLKKGDTREVGRSALVGASSNATAIAKLLRGSVVNAGLWFDDATCTKQNCRLEKHRARRCYEGGDP